MAVIPTRRGWRIRPGVEDDNAWSAEARLGPYRRHGGRTDRSNRHGNRQRTPPASERPPRSKRLHGLRARRGEHWDRRVRPRQCSRGGNARQRWRAASRPSWRSRRTAVAAALDEFVRSFHTRMASGLSADQRHPSDKFDGIATGSDARSPRLDAVGTGDQGACTLPTFREAAEGRYFLL